jgi:hypothetical protein
MKWMIVSRYFRTVGHDGQSKRGGVFLEPW